MKLLLHDFPGACVAFVAGKSGGHILPAFTVAQEMRQKQHCTIVFFSHDSVIDRDIIRSATGVDVHYTIPLLGCRRWYHFIGLFVKLNMVFMQCLIRLKKHKVQKVVSMGGALSVPVCLAAWVLGIPITLYELNAVPGKAVTFLARFAQRIITCFPSARPLFSKYAYKVSDKTYPLRFQESHKLSKGEARALLKIPSDTRVLFILGGSQGSQFLNTFAEGYVRYRTCMHGPDESLVVFHQIGTQEEQNSTTQGCSAIEHFYKRLGVSAVVFGYREDIQLYYAAADLVIARAGAGTLFELIFFAKRSLIIPLEATTTKHQLDNAYAMAAQYPSLFSVYRQLELEHSPEEMYRYVDVLLSTT